MADQSASRRLIGRHVFCTLRGDRRGPIGFRKLLIRRVELDRRRRNAGGGATSGGAVRSITATRFNALTGRWDGGAVKLRPAEIAGAQVLMRRKLMNVEAALASRAGNEVARG